MMNIKTIVLLLIALGLGQTVSAQKYFVYDGDEFSIMFKCNSDNTQVLDVQFSAKDDNGEWQWYKFDIYDSEDYEDTETAGFTFFCKDGADNKYAVDYFRDLDFVMVYAVNADGSYGSEWELDRRADE
jgi:hypothetical protein